MAPTSVPDPTASSKPSAEPVLRLLEAFRWSQAFFTAVELGLFDLLAAAPLPAAEVAATLGSNLPATELLLDSLVVLQLLEKTARPGPDQPLYALLPAAATYCTTQSPDTLNGYALYSRKVLWKLWAELPGAIREGSHRWNAAFGMQGPIFSHFFETPQAMRTFLRGMHGFGQLASPQVVDAVDLSGYQTLCDVGGGTGHLAQAAQSRWPNLTVSVFDLPHVINILAEFSPGVIGYAGDFFRDPLPVADVYCFCRILHDWNDDTCALLLKKAFDHLPSGGMVLVVEAILAEDHLGPSHAVFQSLNMLSCTEGKERSFSEYQRLLHSAGFTKVGSRHTGAPVDVVYAFKP